MALLGLGRALESLGKNLPTVGIAIDEYREKKRKLPMEDLAMLLKQQEAEKNRLDLTRTDIDIEEEKRKRAMAEEGRTKLGEFESTWQEANKPLPVQDVGDFSMSEKEGNKFNELERIRKTGPIPFALGSGLYKYSDYEPGIKSTLEGYEGQEKPTKLRQTVASMKDEDFKKIQELPEGPEKEKAKVDYFTKWAPGAVYGVSPEGIQGALQKQQALIPGNIRQAGGAAAASEAGRALTESDLIRGGTGKKAMDMADDMQKQFENTPVLKDLRVVYTNLQKAKDVMNAYREGKASPYEIDQSLAFFANKALDPNSVVMPGEFERYAKGLGYKSLEAMVMAFAKGGLRLTDNERIAMLNIANRAVEPSKLQAQYTYDLWNKKAIKRGIDPEDVTGGYDFIFKSDQKSGTNKIDLAKQALADPQATDKEKERARAILKQAGQ